MSSNLIILCAGAAKAALADPLTEFTALTGVTPVVIYGTTGALQARIEGGEPADVFIAGRPALEQLAVARRIDGANMANLGRVGVGLAVRRLTNPLPDISTVLALREVLLEAASLAYGDPQGGDSSGKHFRSVLNELGIAERVREKTLLAPLGLAVAEYVSMGQAAIGATQSSVILANAGVVLAGMLPEALQHYTTYSYGVLRGAPNLEGAMQIVRHLSGQASIESFARTGFAQ
jgi:molybdate transport system substrate-binding protein